MSTRHGVDLNQHVRLEVSANDVANAVTNHSGQTGTTAGWAGNGANITLAAITNPTRSGQTLAGAYTGGKTIRCRVGANPLTGDRVHGPAIPVTPGDWVAAEISAASPWTPPTGYQAILGQDINFYDAGGANLSGNGWTSGPELNAANPWTVTTSPISPRKAPAGAVTARVVIVPAVRNISTGALTGWASQDLYLTKLMMVTSRTAESVTGIPFNDGSAWQNILGSALNINITRGGQLNGVTDDLQPGQLTATVADAVLDPLLNTRMHPGRKVRVTACPGPIGTTAWEPLFTGTITDLDVDYSPNKGKTTYRPRITLLAYDPVSELLRLPGPYAHSGPLGDKIRTALNDAPVLFEAPAGSTSAAIISVDANSNLWDQLTRIRDTFPGAEIYCRRDGIIVARAITDDYRRHFLYSDIALVGSFTNIIPNPDSETGPASGTGWYVTPTRTTDWAATGTASTKLTTNGPSGGRRSLGPIYTGNGPNKTTGWITFRTTVKAIVACRIGASLERSGDPTIETFTDLAAGDTADLVVHKQITTGNAKDVASYINIYNPGTTTPYTTASVAACMVDNLAHYWTPDTTTKDTLAGRYWDGTTGGLVTWTGTEHNSPSTIWIGADVSYLDLRASFGTNTVVNSLTVTRHNTLEVDGEKTYGPYVNLASQTAWVTRADKIIIVDGDPDTIATAYLRTASTPQQIITEVTLDPTHPGDWGSNNPTATADIYDAVRIENNGGNINSHAIIVGIDHVITPARWDTTLHLRPRRITDTSTITNSSGTGAGPTDTVPGAGLPNGEAVGLTAGGTQTINNITITKVTRAVLDTVTTQGGIEWVPASNRFTVNRAGIYLVHGRVAWEGNSAGTRLIYIYVNGTQKVQIANPPPSAIAYGQALTVPIPLKAGDYIELFAYQSSGTGRKLINNAGNCGFTITYQGA